MNLQLFGLGQVSRPFFNANNGAGDGGAPTGGADPSNNQNQDGTPKSFDDILKEADEKVAFLKLETLVIETYENKAAKMESGAIDHVAINVKDIEEVYQYIEAEKMNTTKDTIHFLPFWDNGVRFFTIEGPNKEKVEFSQYL